MYMHLYVHIYMYILVCVYMYITSIIVILLMQTIGGVLEEFIFAPRIDNQLNCYAGLEVCNLHVHVHVHVSWV